MSFAEAAIVARDISKSYGRTRAVDGLDFRVERGEVFALLGPNGSGKTTTIRMILDILRPDSGSIAVLGQAAGASIARRIGYLPEERGLYRNAPVLEVMAYLGQLKGMNAKAARSRSLALLERLDLDAHAGSKVRELSKGMQQKVQFAVTVLHEPELIIVDEPFSGLDPVNTQVLETLLREMRARGVAIVMSTHQMHQVEAMADRLLMISEGRQKLYGPVGDIRRQFASHALLVEGRGDWSRLAGVRAVDAGDRPGEALLQLESESSPDSVLAAIAAAGDMHIRRFELATPGLSEIFIRVVEGE
ncbi:MAG: ATP-binding cassette domain-containing protein [Anaerolineaceae bacterium]|nr:ATP-binding cassette domain-containing protein [Anaerolineaceae bacterium]